MLAVRVFRNWVLGGNVLVRFPGFGRPLGRPANPRVKLVTSARKRRKHGCPEEHAAFCGSKPAWQRRSPQPPYPIGIEHLLVADNSHVLRLRLGDQHAVEGVAMRAG